MANASVLYQIIQMDFRHPELTEVYVFLQGTGDYPFQIDGWHHKTFPASKVGIDIYKELFDGTNDPILWDHGAPK